MTRTRLTILLLLIGLAAGCGGPPPPPSVDDVYSGLNEDVPRLDPSILANRRIVIDPGHGGYFPGTVGQDSLAEKGVNLGVSLYLWGLLKEAGADAILTRSSERDFLIESDSTLVSDLRRRVEMVDSLAPDMLISIHHNAQPARDSQKNAVETYYRFGDPASRDLAFAVHRHLMRNVGIPDGEVRPGNYYILRNVDVPAILGEGSYLTHPGVEDKLKLSEKQRLEAEAYFLGILDYFTRGTPRLALASPKDSVLNAVPILAFNTEDVGGPGIDPGGIEMMINGRRVNPAIDSRGGRITYAMPWDSPNRPYDAALSVRNMMGNTSRVERVNFSLNLPAENAVFEMDPAALPAGGGTVRVRARLLDRRGLTVADGTTVLASSTTGETPDTLVVGGGFVEFPVTLRPGASGGSARLDVGGRTFESKLGAVSNTVQGYRRVILTSATDRKPIRNATITISGTSRNTDHFPQDSVVANGSQSGVYFLPTTEGPHRINIVAKGHRLLSTSLDEIETSNIDTLALEPWFDGVLHGRRFLLDPEGGFGTEPGMGPLGLSGPFANLRVAQYLAEYLEAAGAEVAMSRTTEETLSPRDVVALTNRFGADRYIEIRHRATVEDTGGVVDAYHFPGSRTGTAMANTLQNVVATSLGLGTHPAGDQVTFPLQQTACPAIVIEFPSIAQMDEELRLGEPWYQRQQAYAVLKGILAHYGNTDSASYHVVLEGDTQGSDWLISLDRTWHLLTTGQNQLTFSDLPDGDFLLEARRGSALHTVTITIRGGQSGSIPLRSILQADSPRPD